MYLAIDTFKTVVANTPLISIDLVVWNAGGEVLLGKRLNRPAQGFWFVPGGRVQKNETLDAAFIRLTESELGQAVRRGQADFLGVYEHFYMDNFSGTDFSTHYVVLAYQLSLPGTDQLPKEQHETYVWFSLEQLLAEDLVHANSKAYFLKKNT